EERTPAKTLNIRTWRLGSKIGQGAYGTVHKALEVSTGMIFAVKQAHILLSEEGDRRYVEKLSSELDIFKNLRHPNIVSYLGHEFTDGVLSIFMEYLSCGSLKNILDDFGPLKGQLLTSTALGMIQGGPFARVDLAGFGYIRLSYVGRGNYASVQLVEEAKTGQMYVAKCVSLAALTERNQELARQEVVLLEALRHPLIVAYHCSFVVDSSDMLVIVMEYCPGGDLRKFIQKKAEREEHFSEDEIMTWLVQIGFALQYMHSQRVHRDLKSSNVFLSQDASTIKLGDFGISCVLEGTSDAAVTMVGTPYYMSPEVCRSEPYSWKSDVWSLGCILYELCMLKHAFESSSLMGLVYKIISDSYEPIPPLYSQDLSNLVCELLAKDVRCRPALDELLSKLYVQGYAQQRALSSYAEDSVAATAPVGKPVGAQCYHAGSESVRPALPASGDNAPACATLPDIIFKVLRPPLRTLLLASRVRQRLVAEKLNWISALASFDKRGQGSLPAETMCTALARLGLSQAETAALVQSLLPEPPRGGAGGEVPLSNFQDKLAKAGTCLEIKQLQGWARQLLEPFSSSVAVALRTLDAQQQGRLSAVRFRSALQELVPGLSSEQLDVLELLADKDESGSIDYMRFADVFGAPPPPPPLPDAAQPASPTAGPETPRLQQLRACQLSMAFVFAFVVGGVFLNLAVQFQDRGIRASPPAETIRSCVICKSESVPESRGLDHLHTRSPPVIHRDIKCANVLVDAQFCIKLADFGCSKKCDVSTTFTTIGSIPWMAPEVIHQKHGYGRKADIWSLGCTIIELATAEMPWGKGAFDNPMFALSRIGMSEDTPAVPDSMPAALQDLTHTCVQRSEADRPSSSQLMRHEVFQSTPLLERSSRSGKRLRQALLSPESQPPSR
ncbi:unnamed protein product, partial [Polarella glacialis]